MIRRGLFDRRFVQCLSKLSKKSPREVAIEASLLARLRIARSHCWPSVSAVLGYQLSLSAAAIVGLQLPRNRSKLTVGQPESVVHSGGHKSRPGFPGILVFRRISCIRGIGDESPTLSAVDVRQWLWRRSRSGTRSTAG